jgi:hypothetical protein
MATLNSPGVAVTVIDESFYTPAEPGTTPLIIVATAENKTNGAGTGTALATTKAQVGKAFRVTSQRDLVDLFGVPFFEKTASSSPIHGGERNEFGLLTAYSYLGVSNSAFIVRADVDLGQLEASSTAPGAEPRANQWWLDTANTLWGIQEWDNRTRDVGGQKFVTKVPLVLDAADVSKIASGEPASFVGKNGDYAVVAESNQDVKFFYKNYKNAWALVGSTDWAESHPVVVSDIANADSGGNSLVAEGSTFEINGVRIVVGAGATAASRLATIVSAITQAANAGTLVGVSARIVRSELNIYSNAANATGAGDSSLANSITLTPVDAEQQPGADEQTQNDQASILEDLFGITAPNTYFGVALQISTHTVVPQWKSTGAGQINRPSGSVWIKTTEPGNGARWRTKRWDSALKVWDAPNSPIYANGQSALFGLDRSGGGLNISVGSIYVQSNSTENFGFDETPTSATFKVFRRASAGATVMISGTVPDITEATYSFGIQESLRGSAGLSGVVNVVVEGNKGAGALTANAIARAINGAGLVHVRADVTENEELIISHATGGEIRFYDSLGVIPSIFPAGVNNFYVAPIGAQTTQTGYPNTADVYVASNWQPLSLVTYISSKTAPLNEPVDGQLWYNPDFSEVDLMVHNGTTWKGYNNVYAGAQVIVAASRPQLTTDQGNIDRHIWISTADLENFPTMYRWDKDSKEWELIDKTDQVTEDGVLFADARYGASGQTGDVKASILELSTSDYLDPDAPDPALYPRGMLLWNLRRSGGNVKRYANNYIDRTLSNPRFLVEGSQGGPLVEQSMEQYATDRWVTASANQEDGSGTFGRKAQRQVVVAALKSTVDTSSEIRDEERRNFNLIACPGYSELLSNMINLNLDRGITSFVVGDTPLRLKSDATTLTNWGTNANGALDNNETGIVSYDEYCAVFYPNGFTTDLSGSNAVVPASHMMLRTIALSDQVSYPWFAPAGTRRGGITNATAVGYIDALSGEFQTVALNEGQRDVLYELKVNPITFFNGVGLVNYGQKTRGKNASALDRINVARLTVYLRSQLQKLARPYVFEPNDKITRDEIKSAVESLLLELVSLRAIYDFAVVCDESNNTPARIDRNELYVDVAIEPVKAIEFIYIPLRIKNTGEI